MPTDLGDERSLFARYRAATLPSEEDVRRACEPRHETPVARPWPRTVVGVALAAAVLLALRGVPVPEAPTLAGEDPPAEAAVAEQEPPPGIPLAEGESRPIEGVLLHATGSGDVTTGDHRVALRWVVGTLDIEVEPGRGLDVSVQTPEARIRVIGTGFQVRRTALGTEVTVRHGVVEVACAGADPGGVAAGGSRLCLPTTPASFLGRARALEAAGAPAPEVRAAAERGLAGSVSPSVRGELEVVRIRSFLAEGRQAEALAAAGAYLRAGYPDRRQEVLRVAVSLAAAAQDCEDARAWNAELADGTPLAGCAP
jgi:hypothetical protein